MRALAQGVARCARLGLEDGVDLANVMSSDAHTLNALGRNASGNRKLTRLKMEALRFTSLRIALKDSAARVRLEDLIPASVPRFVGMKLEGGFLLRRASASRDDSGRAHRRGEFQRAGGRTESPRHRDRTPSAYCPRSATFE
ncbi:MAG: hypothetical protein ACKVQU_25100 [Burkholderiales bacterium]